MSPGAAAVLTFAVCLFGGVGALSFLTGGHMAALERGSQGVATLSLIISVAIYFTARSRLRRWELETSSAERVETFKAAKKRPR